MLCFEVEVRLDGVECVEAGRSDVDVLGGTGEVSVSVSHANANSGRMSSSPLPLPLPFSSADVDAAGLLFGWPSILNASARARPSGLPSLLTGCRPANFHLILNSPETRGTLWSSCMTRLTWKTAWRGSGRRSRSCVAKPCSVLGGDMLYGH